MSEVEVLINTPSTWQCWKVTKYPSIKTDFSQQLFEFYIGFYGSIIHKII